jgi:hypothetical protein
MLIGIVEQLMMDEHGASSLSNTREGAQIKPSDQSAKEPRGFVLGALFPCRLVARAITFKSISNIRNRHARVAGFGAKEIVNPTKFASPDEIRLEAT